MPLPDVFEAPSVVSLPQLPVWFCPSQIGLDPRDPGVPLLLVLDHGPLWRERLDLSLVDDVLRKAVTPKWTVGLVLPWAAAGLLRHGRVALADDLAVVGGDDLPETRHCPVV